MRIFREPMTSASTSDKIIPEGQSHSMLQEYYALRGWDRNSRPCTRQLQELGLA
ncbi:aldehyde ferredoxin oxidoreductase C-terminal domain-containing protein [Desulfofundulus salinus]|uniref:Aldehyde ferredoxin oxidoreductase C-terminal domain-containing protein n=1 Tax=Desulfofundulus salinus TaxID=2419843 RepID=A0A494WXF3_9FIRM|nr:hypothetical protein D7024_13240 [Desulfofundulus salinum]